MINSKEQIEELADCMIRTGTKLKEFLNEDFIDKKENELTEEERNKYYQFTGFYVDSVRKINTLISEL